jgi:hypothetical protein
VKLSAATLAACLLFASAGAQDASAQTRTRRSTPQRRRSTPQRTPTRTTLDQTQANAARIKLSDQIKNLTRFIYLYGRISKDLETVSAQPGSAEVAKRTKSALLSNFTNLRDGLDQLERQFRFTPGLESSFQKLQGAAAKVEQAESLAAANQYDRAGRQLVEVVTQLTDVLLEM